MLVCVHIFARVKELNVRKKRYASVCRIEDLYD